MTKPAWAKQYSVPWLKEQAEKFKRAHRQHVHGAFGLTKERDVATAAAADSFLYSETSAALCHRLKRDSVQHDFTGAPITIPAEYDVVKAIAAPSPKEGKRLLSSLRRSLLVVEIFQESEVEREIVERMELGRIATKITAGGDIKGLYSASLKPLATSPADSVGLARIGPNDIVRDEEIQKIRKELDGMTWADHYSSYNKRQSWSAFCLRGFDSEDPSFIIKPSEMSRQWKAANPMRLLAPPAWTKLRGRFPTVYNIIRRIPCWGFERVRFMRLTGEGGELSRHADITDRDAGTADGKIARLHLPIVTDPSIEFSSWDLQGIERKRHMRQGRLYYLDVRKPHRVKNDSGIDRIHLVVDAIANEPLRRWLSE